MGTLIPPKQQSPALLIQYLHKAADEKFGAENWKLLYERARLETLKLTGIDLVSKRDVIIFMSAFYFGLAFAIPVAQAAAKAQSLPGRIKRAFAKKPKAEEKKEA